ncbi:MAG: DUF4349 domain-containing protein [Pyrinomonadaceae bacterium]
MRIALTAFVLGLAILAGACAAANPNRSESKPNPVEPSAPGGSRPSTVADTTAKTTTDGSNSPTSVDSAQNNAAAAERKIIKNATLVLDVSKPDLAQQKITALAEAKGGFVVSTSAVRSGDGTDGGALTITVVARVPSNQFEATLTEIRATALHIREEKQTGQDVTAEYQDLDARLRAQQALEAQLLEVMKQAKTVEDLLKVQSKLADVRGEIELIQGKMRLLANQASLSTITVTLAEPTPLLGTTTGFWASLKSAFGDGLSVATAILLFLIRVAVALAPIVVLIFLPIGLLWWYLVRRWRRAWTARKLAKQEMERVVATETDRGA